jgi:hypothetical protein
MVAKQEHLQLFRRDQCLELLSDCWRASRRVLQSLGAQPRSQNNDNIKDALSTFRLVGKLDVTHLDCLRNGLAWLRCIL